MKRLPAATPLLAAALALAALAGCKPSEAAYRDVYQSALARHDGDDPLEGTVYNRYRELANVRTVALGGDTVAVVREFIGYTDDATREGTERYNVVVGRFKQVFNARQMRQRLIDGGVAGHPFILHTREPLYYVVAQTESTLQGALEALRRVEADSSLRLKAPLPFILEPAHMAR